MQDFERSAETLQEKLLRSTKFDKNRPLRTLQEEWMRPNSSQSTRLINLRKIYTSKILYRKVCTIPENCADTSKFIIRLLLLLYGKNSLCMSFSAIRKTLNEPEVMGWIWNVFSQNSIKGCKQECEAGNIENRIKQFKHLFISNEEHHEKIYNIDPVMYCVLLQINEIC